MYNFSRYTGKTTTTENMLYLGGAIKKVGRVDVGNTITDYLPQERERGITIQSAAISMQWKECLINLIDTPGHVDFTMEVESALRVLDGTVVIIDAASGVQAQTRTVWAQSQNRMIPSVAFVNKMDRVGASFQASLKSLRSKLHMKAYPIQLPIGNEDKFSGLIDLITFTKMIWEEGRVPSILKLEEEDDLYEIAMHARTELIEVLAEYDDSFFERYLQNAGTITEKEIKSSLRNSCINEKLVPVLCGASLQGKGINCLLDAIVNYLPSPLDRKSEHLILAEMSRKDSSSSSTEVKEVNPFSRELCALVFKVLHDNARGNIVYVRIFSGVLECKSILFNSTKSVKERVHQIFSLNANTLRRIDRLEAGGVCCIIGLKHALTGDTLVADKSPIQCYHLEGLRSPKSVYSLSIEPERESQQTKLEESLHILSVEDPSFNFEIDEESGQITLKGIGELHLEVVCDKLERQFGIKVNTGDAYVAYRESIGIGYKMESFFFYDKEIGTKRLFAGLKYIISCTKGKDIEDSVDITIADSVKASLNSDEYVALLEGLNSATSRGPFGYPLMGFNVYIIEASRSKDSTPGAFQACAFSVIDNCLRSTSHVILEPLAWVDMEFPAQFLGIILSDFTVKRRGTIKEVENNKDGKCFLHGVVPISEMLSYASSLRSMTQGEGIFSLKYSHLAVVEREYFLTNLKS